LVTRRAVRIRITRAKRRAEHPRVAVQYRRAIRRRGGPNIRRAFRSTGPFSYPARFQFAEQIFTQRHAASPRFTCLVRHASPYRVAATHRQQPRARRASTSRIDLVVLGTLSVSGSRSRIGTLLISGSLTSGGALAPGRNPTRIRHALFGLGSFQNHGTLRSSERYSCTARLSMSGLQSSLARCCSSERVCVLGTLVIVGSLSNYGAA
jgi:hypothetical protein